MKGGLFLSFFFLFGAAHPAGIVHLLLILLFLVMLFILDILHPADVFLLTNPVHADGLVLLADAATGGQSARNCPNGWVDGTYVGMGNNIFPENFFKDS